MRIGIVNDMALACEALRRVVASMPEHELVWTARDGAEAVAMAKASTPDLILMDIMMPKMNGVEATRRIMAESPCPIVVVTSSVGGHINLVYDAMGLGALDAVDTPCLHKSGDVTGAAPLLEKIATIGKLIGECDRRSPLRSDDGSTPAAGAPPQAPMVVIGASTGGPSAVAEILSGFPKDWNPCMIIVQHVDAIFSHGLANWLSERAGHPVELIEEGVLPGPGKWLLAGTNDHLIMDRARRLYYTEDPKEISYRPSVDVFFASVAAHWPSPGVAVLLTGMGRDGAAGLLKLRRREWHTIAQDESTSVVWGMPRAAAEIGAATRVLPLPRIAGAVVQHVERHA
jgi:two-component system response regulator WspF